jgi:hypothetical protein
VRILFLRLVIALSVIMAGMHMPATAHAEVGPDHGLHHGHIASHSNDISDQNGDAPLEVGSDAMHHHHCPIGLETTSVDDIAPLALSRSLIVPANSASLSSRATAPPLQPPSA